MKIAVRYQSRGGNTKAVAEIIANIVGVTAESIAVPLFEPIDILFVGGGAYAHTIDDELRDYLARIDTKAVKTVAAFSTAGGMDVTKKMIPILAASGIHTHPESLPMKFGVKNHRTFVKNGSIKLTDKHIRAITAFAEKVIE